MIPQILSRQTSSDQIHDSSTIPGTIAVVSTRIEPDRLDAWKAFLQAHAAVVEALERELEEERGLPLSWYEVLLWLARAPEGRLRMQQLADRVLITQSGVSRLVDRLERAGYVKRTSCPTDRRGTNAEITREGRSTLRKASPAHLRGVERHFLSHLDEKELAVLRTALDRVVQAHAGGSRRIVT